MKKTFIIIILFVFNNSFCQTPEKGLANEYAKVDKELNIIYNKLKAKLDASEKESLIKAQKAWLQFRDLNCKFSCNESEGGAIFAKLYQDCLIESTKKRIKELNDLMTEF